MFRESYLGIQLLAPGSGSGLRRGVLIAVACLKLGCSAAPRVETKSTPRGPERVFSKMADSSSGLVFTSEPSPAEELRREGPGERSEASDESEGPRFSHPLSTLSPTPETVVRLDYLYRRVHDGERRFKENDLRLTAEYALHPTFSLELEAPYVFRNPDEGASESNFETVGIIAHFASFAFADRGFVLGYGLELGLPTGDDEKEIGSDHVLEIEPFLSAAYKWNDLEVATLGAFTIPTNEDSGEEVENEFDFDVSVHYAVTSYLIGLAELSGRTVLNGEEEGQTVVSLIPGFKLRPLDAPVELGTGVGVPLTGREAFEFQTFLSLFYFF